MFHSIVLTLVGPDRPGLVEAVSESVARHGGNWVESRMAQLSGQFAGILRIEIAPSQVQSLVDSLNALRSENLQVVVVPTDSDVAPARSRQQLHLNLVGQDRPGIVRDISQVLAKLNVNLEELHTECKSAPMSGEALFTASARLGIPDGMALPTVIAAVEQIASDLMVDINVEPVRSTPTA